LTENRLLHPSREGALTRDIPAGRSSDFRAGPGYHASRIGLPGAASQPPDGGSQCVSAPFVPGYRCGAVPDFHRIPS